MVQDGLEHLRIAAPLREGRPQNHLKTSFLWLTFDLARGEREESSRALVEV